MKYDAIILAGGKGERAGLGYNKVLFKLKNGKTVLEEACHLFLEDDDCKQVIIVGEKINNNDPKINYTKGGDDRVKSVRNGLALTKSEYTLIHDGARPFLNNDDLAKIKKAVYENGAALLAKKCVDTVKYSTDGFVEKTLDRNNIYLAQTPQGAKTEYLIKAYQCVTNVTDDASALEQCGHKVKIVIGASDNIKLTNEEDFRNL